MKIERIKAVNFWSYETLDFVFNKGLCLIDGINYDEGGSNGSGKSALFNSVCFALFGLLPKNIKIDQIVRYGSKKSSIEILLSEDDIQYRIERTRQPASLHFFVNDKNEDGLDAKETQEKINQKLGISFQSFINSVYFAQNTSNFIELNDESKKDILSEILSLSIFDKAFELSNKKLKQTELHYTNKKGELSLIQSKKKDLESRAIQFKEKSDQFEMTKEEGLSKLAHEQMDLTEKVLSTDNELRLLKKELENSPTIDDALFQKQIDEIDAKLSQIQSTNTQIMVLDSQLSNIKKSIEKLHINEDQCPTCLQKIDQLILANQVETLMIEYGDLNNKISALRLNALEKPSDLKSKRDKILIEKNSFTQKTILLKEKISLKQKSLDQLSQHLKSIQDQIDKLENTTNTFLELLMGIDEEIKQAITAENSFVSDLDFLQNELTKIRLLKETFSDKGIKSYILDNIINELNFRTNFYLSELFDENIRIEFVSESLDSKGNMKQSIKTVLYLNNEESSIGLMSGGEYRRITFAVNLALADIIANRSQKEFNIMFLDEVFDGLDKEGKERAMNLLIDLSSKKDSIFVIDHDTCFQALFHSFIKIEKHGGISRILE